MRWRYSRGNTPIAPFRHFAELRDRRVDLPLADQARASQHPVFIPDAFGGGESPPPPNKSVPLLLL
jgi:hypothetical protein